MGIGAAIGGIASGLIGASGAKSAAKSQSRSADQQVALQREIYEQNSANFKPFLDAGTNALAGLQYELGMGAAPKNYQGFQQTPGYQFQLEQGQAATNAVAGARGGLNSGATLQALSSFNQGLANQEYGNYYNRLAGLTNLGQASAGQQAAAGQNFASNAGQAIGAAGNAAAAGAVGQANAWTGAIQNGMGAWAYQQALNRPAANPVRGTPGVGIW